MRQSLFIFASLIVPLFVLSLPQKSPRATSSSVQNENVAVNKSTSDLFTNWPPAPFRVHVDSNTYIHIIALPLLTLPFDKESIKFSLFEISDEIGNSYNPRTYLPGQTKFSFGDEDISVYLEFFAPNMRSIRYGYARKIVDELYDLTNYYGAREITWADVEIDGVIVSHMWFRMAHNLMA